MTKIYIESKVLHNFYNILDGLFDITMTLSDAEKGCNKGQMFFMVVTFF